VSIARINRSKFAARLGKQIKCEKCREPIEKGETYIWYFVGFRSRLKHVRHDRPECRPRTSELESSNKAEAFAAIEEAEDALAALRGEPGEASDIDEIVSAAAESINEVAGQYREADESFGGGGSTVSAEIADELEGAAQELESFQADTDEPDACERHTFDGPGDQGAIDELAEQAKSCDDCRELRREWWDSQVEAALEAVSGVSL
jgi:hypothetical protein